MTWLTSWEVIRWVLPLAGLAVGWWVRDRRKDKAAADVAERTVPADVKLKDIGADQAELVYVTQAFEAERASFRRQISEREAEIQHKNAELAHRDQLIASLRVEAEDLRDRLAEATRQLASVLARLDELTDQTEES